MGRLIREALRECARLAGYAPAWFRWQEGDRGGEINPRGSVVGRHLHRQASWRAKISPRCYSGDGRRHRSRSRKRRAVTVGSLRNEKIVHSGFRFICWQELAEK